MPKRPNAPTPTYDRFANLLSEQAAGASVELPKGRVTGTLPAVHTLEDAMGAARAIALAVDASTSAVELPFKWRIWRQQLFAACLLLISDWFPSRDLTVAGLVTLLGMAGEFSMLGDDALDGMFGQIEFGETYSDQGDGKFSWRATNFKRNHDGRRPADVVDGKRGLAPNEDTALGAYDIFRRSCPTACRRQVAQLTLESLEALARECGCGREYSGRQAEILRAAHRALGGGQLDALEKMVVSALVDCIDAEPGQTEQAGNYLALLADELDMA